MRVSTRRTASPVPAPLAALVLACAALAFVAGHFGAPGQVQAASGAHSAVCGPGSGTLGTYCTGALWWRQQAPAQRAAWLGYERAEAARFAVHGTGAVVVQADGTAVSALSSAAVDWHARYLALAGACVHGQTFGLGVNGHERTYRCIRVHS